MATTVLIVSAVMDSFNFYPYSTYGFVISNALWVAVGLVWKRLTLVLVNLVMLLIYLAGSINALMK